MLPRPAAPGLGSGERSFRLTRPSQSGVLLFDRIPSRDYIPATNIKQHRGRYGKNSSSEEDRHAKPLKLETPTKRDLMFWS